MTREEYDLKYSGGYARNGSPVIVPDDIQRMEVHEPCWMCGQARGKCRHRIAA